MTQIKEMPQESFETSGKTRPLWRVKGIRGATTVERDDPSLIIQATQELIREILKRNGITKDVIISAIFTATPDLKSEFPAKAVRNMGWSDIPMLCTTEMDVVGGITRCIRVLLHVECSDENRRSRKIRHVYLEGAVELRPDLVTS